jgi:D-sedoheptulose 7-phosphate isomerase
MTFQSYRTDVTTALQGVSPESVQAAIDILRRAREDEASVYILGNGGSAATASHFANDLVKMCSLRACALPDMASVVTAYGNDHEWSEMYARALRVLLRKRDVVVGISCGGRSPNVVEALRMSRYLNYPGLRSIGLIGADLECPVAKLGLDALIGVPFRDIRVQEDCHLVICHAIVGELAHARYQAQAHRVL